MPAISIHCILGRVSSPSPDTVVDDTKTVCNSSRWIFDVQFDKSTTLEVRLLDFKHKKPRPQSLLSPHASPLNEAACVSKIFFPDLNLFKVQVVLGAGGGVPHYRVTVDALHSLNR